MASVKVDRKTVALLLSILMNVLGALGVIDPPAPLFDPPPNVCPPAVGVLPEHPAPSP